MCCQAALRGLAIVIKEKVPAKTLTVYFQVAFRVDLVEGAVSDRPVSVQPSGSRFGVAHGNTGKQYRGLDWFLQNLAEGCYSRRCPRVSALVDNGRGFTLPYAGGSGHPKVVQLVLHEVSHLEHEPVDMRGVICTNRVENVLPYFARGPRVKGVMADLPVWLFRD